MTRKIFAAGAAAMLALSSAGYLGLTGVAPAHAAAPREAGQQPLAPDLVRDIQRSLNQQGYDVGTVDGVFGTSTQQALARFQRDKALPSPGQVDSQTLAALGITGLTSQAQRGQAPVPPLASAQPASPNMIQDTQRELQRLGYYTGPVDGRWGARTSQALTAFQQDRGLKPSGRIDEQTLAALQAGGVTTQTGQVPDGARQPAR